MRLIDADALKESIHCSDTDEKKVLSTKQLHEILDKWIDAQPTIEERKTGKWVEVHGYCTPGGDPVWCCSECGKGVHVYGIEHGTYGADISDGQWKACPNCSALMEGEQP